MHDLPLILDITRTHLLSRARQSSIAALGVTFGIGTFIIMMSFMTGLNDFLDGLILNRTPHVRLYNELEPTEVQPIERVMDEALGLHLIHSIKPKKSQERIHNALPILSQLEKDERVKGATPQVAAKVFYLAGSNTLNGIANGIKVADEMYLFNFADYIIEGDPLDLEKGNNNILLGAGIAEKLSLSLGDRIQISTPTGGIIPLKIVGIYQSGLQDVDNVQSYVDLKTAQQLLGAGGSYISDINIKLWDIEQAPTVARQLRQQHQVSALDIQTANTQFETGSSVRTQITYVVSITLLVVAGFGIYNIINMLIYEKMNDIAILKAVGFTGRDVKRIFLTQAIFIGLFGGLLGLLMGFVGSLAIDLTPFEASTLASVKTYPIEYKPQYYIVGLVFGLASALLAGYLPSRKAQRADPVEIIRGQ